MPAKPSPAAAFDMRLLLGSSLLAGAGISLELAWRHARETAEIYGVICGAVGGAPHCAACYAAPLLAWAGLSVLFGPQLRQRFDPARQPAQVRP